MDSQESLIIGFCSGIILMAFFHGILLASIFLFHKKLNAKSNKFLALAILGICVILGYEFVYWLDIEDQIPLFIQCLPLYIRTTIPVGIFYFVVFLIHPKHQLSNFEKMGFIAIGIEILIELLYIPVNLFCENIEVAENYIIISGWFLGVVTAIVFLPLALHKVNQYQKTLYDNYSTTNKKSLRWLQIFLILMLVTTVLGIISFVQYVLEAWDESEFAFHLVTICFVILLFWIGYFLVLQYHWFEIAPFKSKNSENEAIPSKLSSNTINYYNQLKTLLHEEKVYEEVNLTLDNLSERLQISSGYLSQIIKEKEQKNFFEFINSYRVESVKKKLLDENYSNYTIMGIAMECGFNSKSTFNSVFKKFTGETPSVFKRRHN